MSSGPVTSWQIEGEKVEVLTDFLFLGSKITADGDYSHEIRRRLLWQESYDNPRQCVEKQRHYSDDKGSYSQGCSLLSGHIRFWELDRKEGKAPKNWCLWTVVGVKTPESCLYSKEIKLVNIKGNQPWILIVRTHAEAEAPIFWSSDSNSWLIGKVPDAGKDWGQNSASRMRWLDGITNVMDVNLGKLKKSMRGREALHAIVHGVTKSWTWLGNWTTTT